MPARRANEVLYISEDGVAFVDVSTPKYPDAVTLIDEADLHIITGSLRRWSASQRGGYVYVIRNMGKGKTQRTELLHRVVLGLAESAVQGDHIRHDTLDNRRSKLREASIAQNGRNSRSRIGATSGYLGVHRTRSGRWSAQIRAHGENRKLGLYATETDAARAYDAAAREYFREFANLNFPEAVAA